MLIFYFAILGIGYLLIEIVLIQKFAIFLSSPVYALAVVLGIMLISSGIGGYFSHGLSKKNALLSFIVLGLLMTLAYTTYGALLETAMFLSFPARVVFACVLIAPLGITMGIPFPYGMSVAKRALTKRHAGLFFGINGAFSAVATPLAFILSQVKGFNSTMIIGGSVYMVCFFLLMLVSVRENVGQARRETAPKGHGGLQGEIDPAGL